LELAKAVSDRQSTLRKCCGGVVPEPGDAVSVRASQRVEGGRTKGRVYQEARRNGFEGRSKMSKAELEQAAGR